MVASVRCLLGWASAVEEISKGSLFGLGVLVKLLGLRAPFASCHRLNVSSSSRNIIDESILATISQENFFFYKGENAPYAHPADRN